MYFSCLMSGVILFVKCLWCVLFVVYAMLYLSFWNLLAIFCVDLLWYVNVMYFFLLSTGVLIYFLRFAFCLLEFQWVKTIFLSNTFNSVDFDDIIIMIQRYVEESIDHGMECCMCCVGWFEVLCVSDCRGGFQYILNVSLFLWYWSHETLHHCWFQFLMWNLILGADY